LLYKDKDAEYLSPIIKKDKQNLQFALGKQEQTNIYVDRTDKSFYYFDLEFLIEK
jgi:hypothetical protein